MLLRIFGVTVSFIPHGFGNFLLFHPHDLSFSPTVSQIHQLEPSNAVSKIDEDAKAASAKILTKWRPQVLTENSKTSYILDTNGTNPSLAPEPAEYNAASAASETAKSLQGHPVLAAV